jgi:hypothetical protein
MHDKIMHGARPLGPHFTNKDHERYGSDKAIIGGTVLDLGECPYFKMPLGGHKFRVAQIDRDIYEMLKELK